MLGGVGARVQCQGKVRPRPQTSPWCTLHSPESAPCIRSPWWSCTDLPPLPLACRAVCFRPRPSGWRRGGGCRRAVTVDIFQLRPQSQPPSRSWCGGRCGDRPWAWWGQWRDTWGKRSRELWAAFSHQLSQAIETDLRLGGREGRYFDGGLQSQAERSGYNVSTTFMLIHERSIPGAALRGLKCCSFEGVLKRIVFYVTGTALAALYHST